MDEISNPTPTPTLVGEGTFVSPPPVAASPFTATEPVYETAPIASVGADPTPISSSSSATPSTGSDWKAKFLAALTKVKLFAEEHAIVIFAVAVILVFVVLFVMKPLIGLIALAVIAALSGWIAYHDLKKKNKL
jgi:hypothetical protein